jgi:hypothetical protein
MYFGLREIDRSFNWIDKAVDKRGARTTYPFDRDLRGVAGFTLLS